MTKSSTPITDAASMSLASIRNSTASRMAYFVPSEVARGLELGLASSATLEMIEKICHSTKRKNPIADILREIEMSKAK